MADEQGKRLLIGLIDLPGSRRDALANLLTDERCAVAACDGIATLPSGVAVVVAHVEAVSSHEWARLAERLPTVVVAESRGDECLLPAVEAGLVDYLISPREHGSVLRSLLKRAAEHHQLAHEHAKARARLEELNEHLETHLALLRQDQQAGGQIQQRLLPQSGQHINGVSYEYCLSPSLYLSGDFLEYQAIDERFSLFYFADVSGHGASSAFVTVLLKLLFARAIRHWEEHTPETFGPEWLALLNRELIDSGIGKHATVMCGVMDRDTRTLHYTLGAQLPMPVLVTPDGELRELEGSGRPVGLFPDTRYPAYRVALPERFRLWLARDGVLECLPGEALEDRTRALHQRILSSEDVQGLRRGLALDGELPDDLTLMTLTGFHDG